MTALGANARLLRWSPRVPRSKILRLYECVASGILDDTLIDEVAYAFYARCQDMTRIAERRVVVMQAWLDSLEEEIAASSL